MISARTDQRFQSGMTVLIARPTVQLKQVMMEQSEKAESASVGLVRRAKPTEVKIATGNPNVRMIEVVLTV